MARPLTDKQKLFCINLSEGMSQTEAAVKAGYAESSAHVTACKMLKDAKIIEYINFLRLTVEEIFVAETKKSLQVLKELRDNPATSDTVRMRTAQDLLDRAGHSATQKMKADIQTTHSGSITANNQQQIHIIQEIVNKNDQVADTLLQAFRERQQSIKAIEEKGE